MTAAAAGRAAPTDGVPRRAASRRPRSCASWRTSLFKKMLKKRTVRTVCRFQIGERRVAPDRRRLSVSAGASTGGRRSVHGGHGQAAATRALQRRSRRRSRSRSQIEARLAKTQLERGASAPAAVVAARIGAAARVAPRTTAGRRAWRSCPPRSRATRTALALTSPRRSPGCA